MIGGPGEYVADVADERLRMAIRGAERATTMRDSAASDLADLTAH